MEEQPPEMLPGNGKVPYRFFKPAKVLLETTLKYGGTLRLSLCFKCSLY